MKYKILIVDDSYNFRGLLRNIIKKNQDFCELAGEAKNGQEAVNMYKQLQPDIVTMDLSMPVKNGVEATKEILEINPNAKIIVVTGTTDESLVQAVKDIGIKYIVNKPFQAIALVNVLKSVIEEEDSLEIVEEEIVFTTPDMNKNNENDIKEHSRLDDNKLVETAKQESLIKERVEIPKIEVVTEVKPEIKPEVRHDEVVEPKQPIVEPVYQPIESKPIEKVYEPIKPTPLPTEPVYEPPVYKPMVEVEQVVNNHSVVDDEDEDDEDELTIPPSLVEKVVVEDEDDEDEDEDEYTPPTHLVSVEVENLVIEHHDDLEKETIHKQPEYTQVQENLDYKENKVIEVEEKIIEEVVEEIIEDDILEDKKVVQDDYIVDDLEELEQNHEPVVDNNQKPVEKSDDNVYKPLVYKPETRVVEKEVKEEKVEEEVYRESYEPIKKQEEDIISVPNLAEGVFVPQYEDKNALQLKGTSKKLSKPIHWEEDEEEAVDELEMVLPSKGPKSVPPRPSAPQAPPVPPSQLPMQGNLPSDTRQPMAPSNQNQPSRVAPMPPRTDRLPAQPPRPRASREGSPNQHIGHAGNYGSRNNQPPASTQYPVQRNPYEQEMDNYPRQNYPMTSQDYNREPAPPRNQRNTPPPQQPNVVDEQTQQPNVEQEMKKKGGLIALLKGLFGKK